MYISKITAENIFSWRNLNILFLPSTTYSFKGFNGAGKSSILEIAKWVFFKKTNKKNVKSYNAKEGWASVELIENDNSYLIKRLTNSPDTITVNDTVMSQDDFELFMGCTYTTFMSAIMCDQKRVSAFVNEETGTGKAKIFGEMIGAGILDDIRLKVQVHKNSFESEYMSAKSVIDELKNQVDTLRLEFDETTPKEYNERLKKQQQELINLEAQAKIIEDKYQVAIVIHNQWEQYENSIKTVQSINESIKMLKENIERTNATLIGEDVIKRKIQIIKDCETSIKKLDDGISKLNINVGILKSEYSKLMNATTNGICPILNTPCEKIQSEKTQLEKIQSYKNSITSSVVVATESKNKKLEFVKIRDGEQIIIEDETNKIRQIEGYNTMIGEKENTLKYLKTDKPKADKPDLIKMREQVNEMSSKIVYINKEISHKQNLINNYISAKKRLKENEENLLIVERKFSLFKWLFDNIPVMKLRFIDNSKIVVENLINENISKMGLPFIVKIDTQRELSKGDKIKDEFTFRIVNTHSEKEAHRKDLSGGEEVCILLATQFAINHISNSRLEFEMYDEIYGSLDDKNLATIIENLQDRSEKKQVFSISHKDEISNSFNHIINVKKKDGYSFIEER